jgi:hypothetical protein
LVYPSIAILPQASQRAALHQAIDLVLLSPHLLMVTVGYVAIGIESHTFNPVNMSPYSVSPKHDAAPCITLVNLPFANWNQPQITQALRCILRTLCLAHPPMVSATFTTPAMFEILACLAALLDLEATGSGSRAEFSQCFPALLTRSSHLLHQNVLSPYIVVFKRAFLSNLLRFQNFPALQPLFSTIAAIPGTTLAQTRAER